MENGTQADQGPGSDAVDEDILVAVERWVLVSALVLSAVAGLLWKTPMAVGSAAAGGLLAILNLLVLKRTVRGILWGSAAKKTTLGIVVCLKMAVLLATIWAAVRLLGLEPLGVALGVSALVVGIIAGTLLTQPQITGRAQPDR